MLEGRCHAVHFGFVQAVPRGFIAPLGDSLADPEQVCRFPLKFL
jgi:hypothetical protein